MLNLAFLFFAAAAETVNREQSFMQTIIMIAVALFFFYFILWRPEQKRRKQLENQRSKMKKGDKVTAMGIIGTVLKINDSTVILAMCDGAKIEVLKNAITEVHATGAAQDKEPIEKEEKENS